MKPYDSSFENYDLEVDLHSVIIDLASSMQKRRIR